MSSLLPGDVAGVPHWVYRHFDATGACIYIGCTSRPQSRPYARSGRPWFTEVAEVRLDGPYEGVAAFEIEQELILDYLPRHNARLDNGSCLRRFKAVHWDGKPLTDVQRHAETCEPGSSDDYLARRAWMAARVDAAEVRRASAGHAETIWRASSRYVVRRLQEASA